jgi:hypothetical protein
MMKLKKIKHERLGRFNFAKCELSKWFCKLINKEQKIKLKSYLSLRFKRGLAFLNSTNQTKKPYQEPKEENLLAIEKTPTCLIFKNLKIFNFINKKL